MADAERVVEEPSKPIVGCEIQVPFELSDEHVEVEELGEDLQTAPVKLILGRKLGRGTYGIVFEVTGRYIRAPFCL